MVMRDPLLYGVAGLTRLRAWPYGAVVLTAPHLHGTATRWHLSGPRAVLPDAASLLPSGPASHFLPASPRLLTVHADDLKDAPQSLNSQAGWDRDSPAQNGDRPPTIQNRTASVADGSRPEFVLHRCLGCAFPALSSGPGTGTPEGGAAPVRLPPPAPRQEELCTHP